MTFRSARGVDRGFDVRRLNERLRGQSGSGSTRLPCSHVRRRSLTVVAHPLSRRSREPTCRDDLPARRSRSRADDATSRVDLRSPTASTSSSRHDFPPCDAWFGFNNLACFRGLARRKIGRAGKVFYWAVDFVPNRFGPGIFTRAYDRLRRSRVSVCGRPNRTIGRALFKARAAYLRLPEADAAPQHRGTDGSVARSVVPRVTHDAWSKRRVVYLGHLVERQGVERLLRALSILESRGAGITADIVGSGPLEARL